MLSLESCTPRLKVHFVGDFVSVQRFDDAPKRIQVQQQLKRQKQAQLLERSQLLLDDTDRLVDWIWDYLNALVDGKSSFDDVSLMNRKVTTGLTLFSMKVDGMRENAMKEDLDFSDALRGSTVTIRKFKKKVQRAAKSGRFGGAENRRDVMQRLEPCLDYMRAVLEGDDVPDLPYIKRDSFSQQTASSVVSAFNHVMSHILPDRMKEINANKEYYKDHQRRLSRQYDDDEEASGRRPRKRVNFQSLTQDFRGPIAFAKSKKQQDEICKEQQYLSTFGAPDLAEREFSDNEDPDWVQEKNRALRGRQHCCGDSCHSDDVEMVGN